jgi:hypothetical protein
MSRSLPNPLRLIKNSLAGSMALGLIACSSETSTQPVVYPEIDSEAAALFIARCSGCHVAPQPDSRPARLWPGIVQRMQMRMENKGFAPLNKDELVVVLDYVQRNARGVDQ